MHSIEKIGESSDDSKLANLYFSIAEVILYLRIDDFMLFEDSPDKDHRLFTSPNYSFGCSLG